MSVTISRRWHRRWLYAHCPPYRWWKHSTLCRRWTLWRWKRAMSRLNQAIGAEFAPAMERTITALRAWQKDYEETRP